MKYNKGLRWPLFDILNATTNQKHMGVMEEGQDWLHSNAKTLGEGDGNNEPIAEGDNNDNDKYDKDGGIADDDNKYTIGVDGVNEPLDKGNNKYDTLSAPPTQACPVLGLLANLKQHVRLSEACLVEATSDNDLSVERNSMSN